LAGWAVRCSCGAGRRRVQAARLQFRQPGCPAQHACRRSRCVGPVQVPPTHLSMPGGSRRTLCSRCCSSCCPSLAGGARWDSRACSLEASSLPDATTSCSHVKNSFKKGFDNQHTWLHAICAKGLQCNCCHGAAQPAVRRSFWREPDPCSEQPGAYAEQYYGQAHLLVAWNMR
jgi:hypothetical protein